MSPGAQRFIKTIEAHGMRSTYSPARRMLPVRIDWVTHAGHRGHTTFIAPSTLDALKMLMERLPGAVCIAKVIR